MDKETYQKNFKPIIIKDLFMDKSPSTARWIPGFVYRLISRILRLDFTNYTMLYEHGAQAMENVRRIIAKAKQTKRDIIPIHVSGRLSNFFYNLSNFRKFLGIKLNVEMFFLPNESIKHQDEHFKITIGKPISYKTFNSRFTPKEWAIFVQDHTYSLEQNQNQEFKYLQT